MLRHLQKHTVECLLYNIFFILVIDLQISYY